MSVGLSCPFSSSSAAHPRDMVEGESQPLFSHHIINYQSTQDSSSRQPPPGGRQTPEQHGVQLADRTGPLSADKRCAHWRISLVCLLPNLVAGCLNAQPVLVPALAAQLRAAWRWPTLMAASLLALQYFMVTVSRRLSSTWLADQCDGVRVRRFICLLGLVLVSLGHLAAYHASSVVGLYGGQSLLAGVGYGLIIESARSCLPSGLSSSSCFTGGQTSVPAVLLAPALALTAGWYGRRPALLLEAAICLLCALLAMLLMKPTNCAKDDLEISPESTNPARPPSGGRDRTALWYQPDEPPLPVLLPAMAADILAAMSLSIPDANLQLLAGLPAPWTAGLFGLLGLAHLTGAYLAAWLGPQLAHQLGRRISPLVVARAAVACLSAVLIFLGSLPPTAVLWLVALCAGLGLLTGLWTAVTTTADSTAAIPAAAAAGLAGQLVCLLLAALLVDVTASPRAPFYLAGGLMAASGLAYSLAILLLGQREKRQNS